MNLINLKTQDKKKIFLLGTTYYIEIYISKIQGAIYIFFLDNLGFKNHYTL